MSTGLLERPETQTPERYQAHPEGDTVLFARVPVWKEHLADLFPDQGEGRKKYKFGKAELQKVVDHCNFRIADTGSYATICVNHTDDEGKVDPVVVGFAGPYYLDKLGKLKPLWCIDADFHIFASDLELVKRYPRVSVEYWCSESEPYNGYFDPISLLGARTPELDLGIRYHKHHEGGRVIRYSRESGLIRYEGAVSPGGSNAYVPGCTTDDKEKKKYGIIDDLAAVGGAAAKGVLNASKDETKRPDDMNEGQEDQKTPYAKEPGQMSLSHEDLMQIVEAFKPVIHAAVSEEIAAIKGKETEPEGLGDDEVPLDDEMPNDNGEVPADNDQDQPEVADEAPPEGVDDMPAEETGDEEEPARYDSEAMKQPPEEDDMPPEGVTKSQYAKVVAHRDELKTKYEKLVQAHGQLRADHQEATSQLEKVAAGSEHNRRYAKLSKAISEEGYTIDADEELKACEDMTPAQFDTHVDKRMPTRYQRVRIGGGVVPRERPRTTSPAPKTDSPEDIAKRSRYSKKAQKLYAERGGEKGGANFQECLQEVIESNGKATEPVVG